MFETLTERLQAVFYDLRRHGKLSERDVDDALRQVRLALLEADVNYRVSKDFIERVRERAVGQEVMRSLTPAQQVVKIVHEELIGTLGHPRSLNLSGATPRVIMLVGLHGSGKTTTAAKLALHLRKAGERPYLVAGDTYRPAAVDQLEALGRQLSIPVYSEGVEPPPPEICRRGVQAAAQAGASVVLLDTAGRLQIDDEMMAELEAVKALTNPQEVLLVADAMTGQEAVQIAEGFDRRVGLTGLILTKSDGDARGGAAISMRAVTGVPIKFLGTGEKTDALEVFHPDRLASRILGMGDVLTLIERAEAAVEFEEADALEMEEKLRTASFTLEDFQKQIRQVKKMGPLGQLLDLIPGMGQISAAIPPEETDRQLKRIEAIINSMTPAERHNPRILNANRRRRIAAGSGTSVQEVNLLIRQFREMQQMMKQIARGKTPAGLGGLFR
jgi:signal recognition particle subunit SRP54